MDPLKSYCSVTRGNHLLLGYLKMPAFFSSHSLPGPCPGKQGSSGTASHHAASLAWTTLPDLSLLARLAGKPDFPQKCTQQWCQSGCKAKIWSMHGGQCCHGAVRGSHGARAEADISQVPASGWGPGCPRRRGTEHGGFGCVSFSWHWPWSILHIAPAPAGMESVLSQVSGCRRGRFVTGATQQVVKKQWYFSRHSYWPLSQSPCSLYVTRPPYFWISAWEALCTYP